METVVELPNNPYYCTLNFQPIPTGEIPPPDYETVIRNGCGSVNIPINLKREVSNIYPTLVPLVPVGSEIRRVAENPMRSTLRIIDNNNDAKCKARANCIVGTLAVLIGLLVFCYFVFNFSY